MCTSEISAYPRFQYGSVGSGNIVDSCTPRLKPSRGTPIPLAAYQLRSTPCAVVSQTLRTEKVLPLLERHSDRTLALAQPRGVIFSSSRPAGPTRPRDHPQSICLRPTPRLQRRNQVESKQDGTLAHSPIKQLDRIDCPLRVGISKDGGKGIDRV